MKNLRLNAWERLMLSRVLPEGGGLQEVAIYLRILETLRLKEDEREAVGWQENPETGRSPSRALPTSSTLRWRTRTLPCCINWQLSGTAGRLHPRAWH